MKRLLLVLTVIMIIAGGSGLVIETKTPIPLVSATLVDCYQEGPSKSGKHYYYCDFQYKNQYKTILYQRQVWRELSNSVGKKFLLRFEEPGSYPIVLFFLAVVFAIFYVAVPSPGKQK